MERITLTENSKRIMKAVEMDWAETTAGKHALSKCDEIVRHIWNNDSLSRSDIEFIAYKLANYLKIRER